MRDLWHEPSEPNRKDQRRNERIPVHIAIRVSGLDPNNSYFTEKTETIDVSFEGCCFLMQTPLAPQTVLTIRLEPRQGVPSSAKRSLFKVAWQRKTDGGYRTGAFQIQPENIWGIEFPARFVADLTSA